MREHRLLSILLIALFFISNLPHQASATNVLPPQSNTQGYITNLIDSYNALVNTYYARNSNFDSVKANFTLYHSTGSTFKVIVVQSVANVPGYVTLIFIPIGGNQPNVVMDNYDNFSQLYGLGVSGENVTFEHLTFEFSNAITYVSLAYGIQSTDITGDYMGNSTKAAKWLYHNDASTISQPPMTTPNHPQPNPYWDWLVNFWGYVAGIVAFVASVLYIYEFSRKKKRQERVATPSSQVLQRWQSERPIESLWPRRGRGARAVRRA